MHLRQWSVRRTIDHKLLLFPLSGFFLGLLFGLLLSRFALGGFFLGLLFGLLLGRFALGGFFLGLLLGLLLLGWLTLRSLLLYCPFLLFGSFLFLLSHNNSSVKQGFDKLQMTSFLENRSRQPLSSITQKPLLVSNQLKTIQLTIQSKTSFEPVASEQMTKETRGRKLLD